MPVRLWFFVAVPIKLNRKVALIFGKQCGLRRSNVVPVEVGRGCDMSNCKMSLMILCVATATLVYSASACAQDGEFFEGCGVLRVKGIEPCLLFFPDSGEFPRGLGRFSGWENFELGDHIHVADVLIACGGFCTFEGLCFDDDSVIAACPTIPTVSEWGMIALALLVLTAGTMVIPRRKVNPF